MKCEAPVSKVEWMGDELGSSFGGEIPMPEDPLSVAIL